MYRMMLSLVKYKSRLIVVLGSLFIVVLCSIYLWIWQGRSSVTTATELENNSVSSNFLEADDRSKIKSPEAKLDKDSEWFNSLSPDDKNKILDLEENHSVNSRNGEKLTRQVGSDRLEFVELESSLMLKIKQHLKGKRAYPVLLSESSTSKNYGSSRSI